MPNTYEDPQILQQKALAQALMSRGLNPQAIDGHYRRTNQAADLVSALVGTMGMYNANKRQSADDEAYRQTIANALSGPQNEQQPGFVGPPQDQNEYLIKTLAANRRTAPMALEYELKRKMAASDSEAELQKAIRLAQEKKRLGLDSVDPYNSPLITTDGIYSYDHRTGGIRPISGTGGKPVMAPAADPSLAGAKARATASGKAAGEAEGDISKRAIGAGEVLDLITRAEELIPNATSSGIGTVVDKAAGLIGASPQGAEQAQTLKMIQGALVLKMPRMEGPQSNLDQQLYREMAGQLGDSTIPAAQRLAAAKELRRLNEKYAAFNGLFGGGAAPAAPAQPAIEVRDWNDLK